MKKEVTERKEHEQRAARVAQIKAEMAKIDALMAAPNGNLYVIPEEGGARVLVPAGLRVFVLATVKYEYKNETDRLMWLEQTRGVEG